MKILYVEDNDDNIFVVYRRLSLWGHTVLSGGERAVSE